MRRQEVKLKLRSAAAAAIVVSMALAHPALASGNDYYRTLISSSVGDCSQGRLLEHVHDYADVYVWDEDLAIACLTDSNKASWVFVSGTWCDDGESATGERYCSNKEAAAAKVPALFHDQFWDIKGKSAPYRVRYDLLRWGEGRDCTIVNQSIISGEFGGGPVWQCSSIDLGAGLAGGFGQGALRFQPKRIWTEALVPLSPRVDQPFNVPTAFDIDGEEYTYRFR